MSLEVPRIFWPVVIDSTNDDVRFTHAASGTGTFNGTVANATYTSPEDLMDAVVNGLRLAVDGGPTAFQDIGDCFVTYSISTSGVITLNWTFEDLSTPLGIKWGQSTSHQALATLLGFPTANTDYTVTAGSPETATAIGTSQMQHYWTPGVPVESDTGSGSTDFDTSYIATVSTNAAGQQVSTLWTGTPTYQRTVAFSFLTKDKIWTAGEGSSVNQALERLLVGGYAKFRYWPDRATLGTYADYFLREQAFSDFRGIASTRFSSAVERYRVMLAMGRYV